jgi:hypothetical protein
MIEFKIISSPDRSQISSYQHFGAELTFGNLEGDMLIDDPGLAPLQLRVRLSGGQITLENVDESVEVRLNGHAITSIMPLKEKDNISVGKTSIQFIRLDLEPAIPPEPMEYRNAAGRFTPNSKEQALLDGLGFLERSSGSSSGTPRTTGMPKPPVPPVPGRMPPIPPPLPKKS